MSDRMLLQGVFLLALTLGLAWGYWSYVPDSSNPQKRRGDYKKDFSVNLNSKTEVEHAVKKAREEIQVVDAEMIELQSEMTILKDKRQFLEKFIKSFTANKTAREIASFAKRTLSTDLDTALSEIEAKFGRKFFAYSKGPEQNRLTFDADILVQEPNGKPVITYEFADIFYDVVASFASPSKIDNITIEFAPGLEQKAERLKTFVKTYFNILDREIPIQEVLSAKGFKLELGFSSKRKSASVQSQPVETVQPIGQEVQ